VAVTGECRSWIMSDEQTPVDKTSRDRPPQAGAQDFVVPVVVINALGAVLSLSGLSGPAGGDALILVFLMLTIIVPAPLAVGSLLAMWAAFGGGPSPWRLLLVLVPPAVLVSGTLSHRLMDTAPGAWVFGFLLQAALTSLLMLALRVGGAHITRLGMSSARTCPRFQFSLRLLLEWTCAIAVLSATLSLFPREEFADLAGRGKVLFLMVLMLAFHAFLAAVALGLTLAAKEPVVWFMWLATAIVVGMCLLAAIGPEEATLYVGVVWSCQSAWIIGSLWPFRRAGFRLAWRPARPRS